METPESRLMQKIFAQTRAVELTADERSALEVALVYYLDTLDECSIHDPGEHGDEMDCEGWGPNELATLERAMKKVTR